MTDLVIDQKDDVPEEASEEDETFGEDLLGATFVAGLDSFDGLRQSLLRMGAIETFSLIASSVLHKGLTLAELETLVNKTSAFTFSITGKTVDLERLDRETRRYADDSGSDLDSLASSICGSFSQHVSDFQSFLFTWSSPYGLYSAIFFADWVRDIGGTDEDCFRLLALAEEAELNGDNETYMTSHEIIYQRANEIAILIEADQRYRRNRQGRDGIALSILPEIMKPAEVKYADAFRRLVPSISSSLWNTFRSQAFVDFDLHMLQEALSVDPLWSTASSSREKKSVIKRSLLDLSGGYPPTVDEIDIFFGRIMNMQESNTKDDDD